MNNEETQLTKLHNQSDVRPISEPALELYSRATSGVGVMYRSSGPNTGSNSRGGRILKKPIETVGTLGIKRNKVTHPASENSLWQ